MTATRSEAGATLRQFMENAEALPEARAVIARMDDDRLFEMVAGTFLNAAQTVAKHDGVPSLRGIMDLVTRGL